MAINSAQPIVRPLPFQPSRNSHASQALSNTTPMPQVVEASTQNSMGLGGGGLTRLEPQNGAESWVRHQLMSAKTVGLGDLRIKGDWVF